MPPRLDVPNEREDGRLGQCSGMSPEPRGGAWSVVESLSGSGGGGVGVHCACGVFALLIIRAELAEAVVDRPGNLGSLERPRNPSPAPSSTHREHFVVADSSCPVHPAELTVADHLLAVERDKVASGMNRAPARRLAMNSSYVPGCIAVSP